MSRDFACSHKLTSFMVVKSFTFTICTIVSLALMHVHVNWHKLTRFMVVKSFKFTICTIMSLELLWVHIK